MEFAKLARVVGREDETRKKQRGRAAGARVKH
jgi:hypothetical protein